MGNTEILEPRAKMREPRYKILELRGCKDYPGEFLGTKI